MKDQPKSDAPAPAGLSARPAEAPAATAPQDPMDTDAPEAAAHVAETAAGAQAQGASAGTDDAAPGTAIRSPTPPQLPTQQKEQEEGQAPPMEAPERASILKPKSDAGALQRESAASASETPGVTPMETPRDAEFLAKRDALVEKALHPGAAAAAAASEQQASAAAETQAQAPAATEPQEQAQATATEDHTAFKAEARRHSVPVLDVTSLPPTSEGVQAAVSQAQPPSRAPAGLVERSAAMLSPISTAKPVSPLEALAELAASSAPSALRPTDRSAAAPSASVAAAARETTYARGSEERLLASSGSPTDQLPVRKPSFTPLPGRPDLPSDDVEMGDASTSAMADAAAESEDEQTEEQLEQQREEALALAVQARTLQLMANNARTVDPTRDVLRANRAVANRTRGEMEFDSSYPHVYVEMGPLWVQPDDTDAAVIKRRIWQIESAKAKRMEAKVEHLKTRYKTLDADWKVHCEHLDRWNERKERRSVAPTGTGTPAAFEEPAPPLPPLSGRANRRGMNTGIGFGDAVRSEAEFLEILASLESADMQDPNMRAARTTATVPDMLLNPDSSRPLRNEYEDDNGYVADPEAFYLDDFDPDFWSDDEKATFLRKYALYPKQFGKIANFLQNKSTQQCVVFYYSTKKLSNFDYKGLAAARNKERKRKVRPKPKKAKGSALMADLASTKLDELDDVADEMDAPEPSTLPSSSRRKPSMTAGPSRARIEQEDDETPAAAAATPASKKRRATVDEQGEGSRSNKSRKKKKQQQKEAPAEDTSMVLADQPTSGLDDLAAAAALGVLASGVNEVAPSTAEVTPDTTMNEGAEEGKKRSRSSTSSYWSVAERNYFLQTLAVQGKNWSAIAEGMNNKSAAQARNFFTRNHADRDFAEAVKLAQQNAGLPEQERLEAAEAMLKRQAARATAEAAIQPDPLNPPIVPSSRPRMGAFLDDVVSRKERQLEQAVQRRAEEAAAAAAAAAAEDRPSPSARGFGISSLLNDPLPQAPPNKDDAARRPRTASGGGEDTDEEPEPSQYRPIPVATDIPSVRYPDEDAPEQTRRQDTADRYRSLVSALSRPEAQSRDGLTTHVAEKRAYSASPSYPTVASNGHIDGRSPSAERPSSASAAGYSRFSSSREDHEVKRASLPRISPPRLSSGLPTISSLGARRPTIASSPSFLPKYTSLGAGGPLDPQRALVGGSVHDSNVSPYQRPFPASTSPGADSLARSSLQLPPLPSSFAGVTSKHRSPSPLTPGGGSSSGGGERRLSSSAAPSLPAPSSDRHQQYQPRRSYD